MILTAVGLALKLFIYLISKKGNSFLPNPDPGPTRFHFQWIHIPKKSNTVDLISSRIASRFLRTVKYLRQNVKIKAALLWGLRHLLASIEVVSRRKRKWPCERFQVDHHSKGMRIRLNLKKKNRIKCQHSQLTDTPQRTDGFVLTIGKKCRLPGWHSVDRSQIRGVAHIFRVGEKKTEIFGLATFLERSDLRHFHVNGLCLSNCKCYAIRKTNLL